MGVKFIDLNYVNIDEVDRYQNQTKQRSTVGIRDGSLLLIVDVWFRTLPPDIL